MPWLNSIWGGQALACQTLNAVAGPLSHSVNCGCDELYTAAFSQQGFRLLVHFETVWPDLALSFCLECRLAAAHGHQ